jgi:guanylate kinase
MREGEVEGKEYFFTTDEAVSEFEKNGKIIELRAYNTVHGVWKYFTLDDGQIDLNSNKNYLIIATLEAYKKYLEYYGRDTVVPIYIEVDDKVRIHRALAREDMQEKPKYSEMCRRFLADQEDFSEGNLKKAGITRRFKNQDKLQCLEEIVREIRYGRL